MPLATADTSVFLLMDISLAMEENRPRIQAHAFAMDTTRDPAVRQVVSELLAVNF